jgi:hypothetical protein
MAAIGHLANSLAHELNNPLFMISGFTQLADGKVKKKQYETLAADLASIREAVDRATEIIQRTLTVARRAKAGGEPVEAFTGDGTGTAALPGLEPLSAVIQRINDAFGLDLGEADRLHIESVTAEMVGDAEVQIRAAVNTLDNFASEFDVRMVDAFVARMDEAGKLTDKVLDDEEFKAELRRYMLPLVYERARVARQQMCPIGELLGRDEDQYLEFKSSLRWDLERNERSRVIEGAAIKTVAAFLNSRHGGTLLIGVANDRSVLGLEPDYASLRKEGRDDADLFQLHLSQVLENAVVGKQPTLSPRSTAKRESLAPAELGEGTVVSTGAIVFAGSRIGARVILGDQSCVRELVTIGDDVVLAPGAVGVENLRHHQLGVGRHAGNALGVVLPGHGDAGHMRPVPVLVLSRPPALERIALRPDAAGVGDHATAQLLVGEVDAGVHHSDGDTLTGRLDPGLGGVDPLEAPLLLVRRVVGGGSREGGDACCQESRHRQRNCQSHRVPLPSESTAAPYAQGVSAIQPPRAMERATMVSATSNVPGTCGPNPTLKTLRMGHNWAENLSWSSLDHFLDGRCGRTWCPHETNCSAGALSVVDNRLEHPLPGSLREVVTHSGKDEQFRSGDGPGGRLAPRSPHQGVVGAVDDQRRSRHSRQVRRPVAGGQDGDQLAAEPGRIEAPVVGLFGPGPDPDLVEREAR